MTITAIHHGLSVVTAADTSQRLVKPVANSVSNCFNDASSGHFYGHAAGHEGIDFQCPENTPVHAMYSGIVVAVKDNWAQDDGKISYGKYVKIQSYPDQRYTAGFEHVYAHLNAICVQCGQTVKKNDIIGKSGATGNVKAHLHVHVKPFDRDGQVPFPWENSPAYPNSQSSVTQVANLISGCINFACFLPPDDSALPAIVPKDSRLLSPRDSAVEIPVYPGTDTAANPPDPETIAPIGAIVGNQIGCYAIVDLYPKNNPTWYQIRFSDAQLGWVQRKGTVTVTVSVENNPPKDVDVPNVEWVQVQDVPDAAPLSTPLTPYAIDRNPDPKRNVRAAPSIPAKLPKSNVLGQMTKYVRYSVQGKFRDFRDWDATKLPESERCWWQIDLTQDQTMPEQGGWVRSDVVEAYGITDQVPVAWPAPALPQQLEVRSAGSSVYLQWSAPAQLANIPQQPQVTGYRVKRRQDRAVATFDVPANPTAWTEEAPPLQLLHYQVAALAGGTVGAFTSFVSVRTRETELPTPAPMPTPTTEPVPLVALETVTPTIGPGAAQPASDFRWGRNTWKEAVGFFADFVDDVQEFWVQIRNRRRARPRSARALATERDTLYGWVPLSTVEGVGSWRTRVQNLPRPPYLRITAAGPVPLRAGPALGHVEVLRQLTPAAKIWYAVYGQNQDWWQIRMAAGLAGWLRKQDARVTGNTKAVPTVAGPALPALPGPGGPDLPAGVAARVRGPYLNQSTNWGGAWTAAKTGRTVTATFGSIRSPVQYHARQQPEDLLVLPAGFQPVTRQDIRVTGTHVHAHGTAFASEATARFTLQVFPSGTVRYQDDVELDHVGYLRYATGEQSWQTPTALATPTVTLPGVVSDSGFYLNRQVNWGSHWTLERRGDRVTGRLTTTRSPVAYYANQNREVLLLLSTAWRPQRATRVRVTGARRVQANGMDSADGRRVDFHLTVETDGEMRYDRDPALEAAGVGYLRYTVAVAWTAAPRVQVPGAPRDLAVEAVAARSMELDWQAPADDGGARIRGYRIETWGGGMWTMAVAETGSVRTRHDLHSLRSHRRYSWRVKARNAAGWGPASSAVSATTRREAPGRPSRLSAKAAHDQVTLTWQRAAGVVTGYQVQRRLPGGRWRLVVSDTGSAVTYFGDHRVASGTAYQYRVRATHHGEAGTWSDTESVTTSAAPTIPGCPTGLSVAPTTTSQLQLNWLAPVQTGGGVTGYRIERAADTDPRAWMAVAADTQSTALTWAESGLAADTRYRYRVSARNSAGVSASSAEAAGTTRPQLRLDVPSIYPLTAHAEPHAAATVTASFAFFLPERSYDLVAREPGPSGWYRILLFGAARPGPFWLPAAAGRIVGTLRMLQPSMVESGTVRLGSGQVTLAWAVPATDGGQPVTHYRVRRRRASHHEVYTLRADRVTGTVYIDTAPIADGTWYYSVQAVNALGAGPWSDPAPSGHVLEVGTSPSVVGAGTVDWAGGQIALTWTVPITDGGRPITHYRVRRRRASHHQAYTLRADRVTDTTYAETAPTTDGTWYYSVQAVNTIGAGPWSNPEPSGHVLEVHTPPGAVGAGTVRLVAGQVTLTWAAPTTDGGQAITHYRVRRRLASQNQAYTLRASRVTGLAYVETAPSADGTWYYSVQAVNALGAGPWSNPEPSGHALVLSA